MHHKMKGMIVGTLAVMGAAIAATDAEAMPIQPMSPSISDNGVEHVYWRRGYGYGFRRFGYGYGFRRPFYGYRRFYGGYGRGYGFRGPYGYGYRRW